jgi:hypothetical protein
MGCDATGDFDVRAFLQLAGDELRARLATAQRGREFVFERVDAFACQLVELLSTLLHQLIQWRRL